MKTDNMNKVLVVDFGSQTTQLIIRRIRGDRFLLRNYFLTIIYIYIKKTPSSYNIIRRPCVIFLKKTLLKLNKEVLNEYTNIAYVMGCR